MAQDTSLVKNNTFNKGMVKDYNDMYISEGLWTHARNAVNNAHLGEVGVVGNEPANLLCTSASYTIISLIHKIDNEWVVFSTDNTNSEIGIFDESSCTYKILHNDSKTVIKCLNFSTNNLITGAVKVNSDCTYSVYWQDGNNPDRYVNLDNIPYIQGPDTIVNGCVTHTYTTDIDCEKLLLQAHLTVPCYSIKKGVTSGQLLNGSYQAVIAYSVNGDRVTDYFKPSNSQSLWSHSGVGGSLEINITDIDTNFDEFELAIISVINSQPAVKKIGYYNTRQTKVVLDFIAESLVSIPLSIIPIQNPSYYKSDKIYELNGYLLRSGVTTRPEFNYQPIANNIRARWIAVEYPADYYINGGSNTGYLADEVYSFFIRWIRNTGVKTRSYHIPGRDLLLGDADIVTGPDVLTGETKKYQVYNTATIDSSIPITMDDGGVMVQRGKLAYWESSEQYPDDKPEIWGDLCGKKIRHHKFPDNTLVPHHRRTPGTNEDKIIILGIEFQNVNLPTEIDPVTGLLVPVPDIVGYEILRGSREGNKSIIAKGMFNNLWQYTPDTPTGQTPLFTGLFQNFPFNDLTPNKFLVKRLTNSPVDNQNNFLATYDQKRLSFHSPDTTFNRPFLSIYNATFYNVLYGTSETHFEYPYKHPKHKILSNFGFLTSFAIGSGIAIVSAMGKSTVKSDISIPPSVSKDMETGSSTGPMSLLPGFVGQQALHIAIGVAGLVTHAVFYAAQGTQATLDLMSAFTKFRQYAMQVNSYAYYFGNRSNLADDNKRRSIKVSKYIGSGIVQFDKNFRINNLHRNRYVALELNSNVMIKDPHLAVTGILADTSRFRIGDVGAWSDDNLFTVDNKFKQTYKNFTCAYYGALKIKFDNQYGQLDSIIQIPIPSCVLTSRFPDGIQNKTGLLFGGDIYVNRYTEKNPYYFFNTWLTDALDGTEINYRNYINGPFPNYWANLEKFGVDDITASFSNIINQSNVVNRFGISTPSNYYNLDGSNKIFNIKKMFVKNSYFYLFNNGVRDFFVESEINLAHRDYGDNIGERHYDHNEYMDLSEMFRSDKITMGNYYKYDYSLSVSKLYSNYFTWGKMQDRTYDPTLNVDCYEYYPNRLIYSLQKQFELKHDNWKNFLANNYKDFTNEINIVKALNESGAVILFKDGEPVQFTGVDRLQTDSGTKITIGDAGLFSQNMQSLVNADDTLDYASCQSYYSAINTPHGLFYISQKTGKIFNYTGEGLVEISANGMKHWFAKYLPSRLLAFQPDYDLSDNPVEGVGCQAVYDNQYDLVYFSKKDYKPIYNGLLYDYDKKRFYTLIEIVVGEPLRNYVELTNPTYFQECSFTVSYDPKTKTWISYHDWYPDLSAGLYSHFLTTKGSGMWKHNIRTDLYANYYGINYPWEIEFPIVTGEQVTTARSVEYILENYRYYNSGSDSFSILDNNFNRAILYNNEQISGILNLNLKTKNNPLDLLNYPKINIGSIDIQFSKEENKYRFNQFWDITNDRHEFINGSEPMWFTEDNGYKRRINPAYVNYTKSALERKKFRHYGNRLLLSRTISNDIKMLLKIFSTKHQISFR